MVEFQLFLRTGCQSKIIHGSFLPEWLWLMRMGYRIFYIPKMCVVLREIQEEIALIPSDLNPLGSFFQMLDVSIIMSHFFYVRGWDFLENYEPEPGMIVEVVTAPTLDSMVV